VSSSASRSASELITWRPRRDQPAARGRWQPAPIRSATGVLVPPADPPTSSHRPGEPGGQAAKRVPLFIENGWPSAAAGLLIGRIRWVIPGGRHADLGVERRNGVRAGPSPDSAVRSDLRWRASSIALRSKCFSEHARLAASAQAVVLQRRNHGLYDNLQHAETPVVGDGTPEG
jgi:hypothetical protein